LKTTIFTVLALIAFAANSVLCRLALGANAIDASSFTVIRLLSAVLVLVVILKTANRQANPVSSGSWLAGAMLFVYAICFSFAYLSLDTGTGALILFGAVQITMIALSLRAGARMHLTEWLGIVLAFAGFIYLVLPGVSAPSMTGFVLMAAAGIAWGSYTMKGCDPGNPLADTTSNFLRTVPFVVVLVIVVLADAVPGDTWFSPKGVMLAILSGAIASGLGYTVWYAALAGLSATRAAVVQLSVPAIAAAGGVIFVGESITLRLAVSTLVILVGILLVIIGRSTSLQQ